MGFKLSSRPMRSVSSPWRLLAGVGLLLLVVGLCGGWMLGTSRERRGEALPETGPVLMAMQKIGQLRTVSYAMKDVLRQETHREPADWVGRIPGAESLVHWATRNDALVVAEGSVEAGVDLTRLTERDVQQARDARGETILRVKLPPVTIYPPNVRVRVENSRGGLLWNDKNLVPKAEATAGQRFLEAAQKQNIRAEARENAIHTLRAMQRTLGSRNIEFFFADEETLARNGR